MFLIPWASWATVWPTAASRSLSSFSASSRLISLKILKEGRGTDLRLAVLQDRPGEAHRDLLALQVDDIGLREGEIRSPVLDRRAELTRQESLPLGCVLHRFRGDLEERLCRRVEDVDHTGVVDRHQPVERILDQDVSKRALLHQLPRELVNVRHVHHHLDHVARFLVAPGERAGRYDVVRRLTLLVDTHVLRLVRSPVAEGLQRRAVGTFGGAVLVHLVAVLAHTLAEGLSEQGIGPYDAKLAIDHRDVAGDPLEENIVLPLERLGLRQVVGHLDDVGDLADLVVDGRDVDDVVGRTPLFVDAVLVVYADLAVFEGASRHAVLADRVSPLVDLVTVLSDGVAKHRLEVAVGDDHLEVPVDHGDVVRHVLEQLPSDPCPDLGGEFFST